MSALRAMDWHQHLQQTILAMKITHIIPFLVLPALLGSAPFAAAFDCGSTGAYGPMNITNDTTLQLPPDGIFHCTTITVAQGATLRFTNNALNTPVYLLATGDVVVSGTIDVSGMPSNGNAPGKGGPGGFDGGYGGAYLVGQSRAGDGFGPGGGRNFSGPGGGTYMYAWRCAAFATPPTGPEGNINTNCYGNLLLSPLIGGSGSAGSDGTPGVGGAGGGGAILIASNSRIVVHGAVKALAGAGGADCGYCYSGSGGSVRLLAPVVAGAGSLIAAGNVWGGSAWGRIRTDCLDNQQYLSLNMVAVASRGSRMSVFPTNAPTLDIIEVAGNPIVQGTNNAAVFELPTGASTNQTVKVQAENFTGDVPIRVVVTPEHGSRGEFDATILPASGNPPFAVVPVIIPAGSICRIHAWTR
jgi:hypothetical protein